MKKLILVFVCISFCFLRSVHAQVTLNEDAVAPEFASFSGTVLVINNGMGEHTAFTTLKRKMRRFYKGDYIIISNKQLLSGKFSDMNKYHFLVYSDVRTKEKYVSFTTIIIFNRVTGQENIISGEKIKNHSMGKLVSLYVKRMEEMRAK